MRNAMFAHCVICGVRIPQSITDVYCANHNEVAQRALAKVTSNAGLIPRILFLLLMLGILLFASHQ